MNNLYKGNNTFKYGKYKGKTTDWVSRNDPGYIEWVCSEKPNILHDKKKVKKISPDYLQEKEIKPEKLTPNYNFEKETNMTNDMKKIKDSLIKIKVKLYIKYSNETNSNGSVKYNKLELIDTIFDKVEDSNIISKLKSRING